MWLVNFLFLAEWVRALYAAGVYIWRLMGKNLMNVMLHLLLTSVFFGLLNKTWKIHRNRIVRLYVDLFSPDSLILKPHQNARKTWKPYDVAAVFKVFRFWPKVVLLFPIFLTLGCFLPQVLRFIVGGGQWLKDSWNVGAEEDGMYTGSVWTKSLEKLPMGKKSIQFLQSLYCTLCWRNLIHDNKLEHIEKWPPLE